ncbi:MAG: hypothetical protein H0U76_23135 [Ktedonobacteraceae bacterium]|nr:hypothetical protein [Ktedonobacteraceae bacterium]
MNDEPMEPGKEGSEEDPTTFFTPVYTAPDMLVFGEVMTLAKGSGSGDSDGCSAGYYDE